jgi:RNA polymerase sigma-70 factor (ECF subfamily)
MGEPTDGDLLQRLAAGDRDALAPLMERHHRRLYRLVLSYLRDPDEAEDVVQEVFVKAYAHAARWDGRSEPLAWLTRIAVNEAIDRYRRRKRRAAWLRADAEERPAAARGTQADDTVRAREIVEQLEAALDALNEKERAVFVLRHQHEMTLDEITQALGLPLGTVKSCLHRAVHRVRQALRGWRA